MYLSRAVNILQNCPLTSVVFVGFIGSFNSLGVLPFSLRKVGKKMPGIFAHAQKKKQEQRKAPSLPLLQRTVAKFFGMRQNADG